MIRRLTAETSQFMNAAGLVLVFCLFKHFARADESVAPLQLRDVEVHEVLTHYQRTAKTPVFASPNVNRTQKVSIESPTALTKEQGLQHNNTTLLAKYEILIRDTKTGETLVESVTPRRAREPRVKNPEEPESRAHVRFPNTDLRDVLEFYGLRTGQEVFVAINLRVNAVTISSKEPLSGVQVAPFIRDALGDGYGIEFRTLFSGEVLVEAPRAPRPAAAPAVPPMRIKVRPVHR